MSKYGAKKKEIDGIVFDSILESKYYTYLKQLKEKGEVKHFEMQPKFVLQEGFTYLGKKVKPIHYIADFRVIWKDNKESIVDVKGIETSDFKLKKKMFMKRYNDKELLVLTYVQKRGGWITIEENEKRKKEEKKKGEKKK